MEIKVLVKPNSGRNKVEETSDGLLVHLKAKPTDGAANKALIEVLSKHFSIPKTKFRIKRGATSSHKVIAIVSNR